jgi:signal transduction histidine kinase
MTTAVAVAPGPTRSVWPWVAVALAASALLAAAVLVRLDLTQGVAGLDVIWASAWLSYAAVGAAVASRRPANPVGPLLLVAGCAVAAGTLMDAWSSALLATDADSGPGTFLGVLQATVFVPALVCVAPLALLYFPDGRLLGRGWALPAGGAVVAAGASVLDVVRPGTAASAWPLVLIPCAAASVPALVVRWRRGGDEQRQQILWLVVGVGASLAAGLLVLIYVSAGGVLSDAAGTILAAGIAVLPPAGIAVAMLRHRLYDVEMIVRRSIVYAVLATAVTAVFVVVIALSSWLVGMRPSPGGIAAAILVTATVVPAYHAVTGVVERRVFGDRRPERVLALLGQRLAAAPDASAALIEMTSAVREALRSPYVWVEASGARVLAVAGDDRGWPALELPLVHQSQEIGRMCLMRRCPSEGFSGNDERLLRELSPHVAAALVAVRLRDDVQRSRELLAHGLEEERRRLRRDLHDGIGPSLAAISMRLALIGELTPTEGAAQISEVEGLLDATVQEVRRVVRGLRPPALDDLGLVPSLREQADKLGLNLMIAGQDALPDLSAVLEAATYRIVCEALTNVARHASTSTCQLTVGAAGRNGRPGLMITVVDDGVGLHGARPGVGRIGMRERAEEVGGSLAVRDATDGGTEVAAWLPL